MAFLPLFDLPLPCLRPALKRKAEFARSSSGSDSAAGWVERSETHHVDAGPKAMGFAALNPSYTAAITA
jgi:hypothetical protein